MNRFSHRTQTTLLNFSAAALAALIVSFGSVTNAQEASTSYRGTSRDPFSKPVRMVRRAPGVKKSAPAAKPVPAAPTISPAPALQARIDGYKSLKVAAMNRQQPAPKPVTALLLDEVAIVGIFRTPRGYAAMVEATPIKLSYVIYPGEMFYDGQLVAVEENKLVFRRERRYSNGKRETIVETKPLRVANAVTDDMKQTRAAGDPSTIANADSQTTNPR